MIQLGFGQNGFFAAELREKLFPLLAHADAFLYGSGFEAQPGLLEEIERICPIMGNSAQTVADAKDPEILFPLMEELGIPFPEVSLVPPAAGAGWLSKQAGGSGGMHVIPGIREGAYFQRQQSGKPCSLLFLADGLHASPVGYHEQVLAPSPEAPYRFGGAVSCAGLMEKIRAGVLEDARQLTKRLSLRGLNSLDFLVEGERYWVLEINPRLSAGFALYDGETDGARLLEGHLRACSGILDEALTDEPARAHLIYYSRDAWTVPASVAWPDWVADVPLSGATIAAGQPVCTVTAQAGMAEAALALAQERLRVLQQFF